MVNATTTLDSAARSSESVEDASSPAVLTDERFDAYAWLYIATYVTVCVAPSLGLAGTLLRTTCAALGATAMVLLYFGNSDSIRLRRSEQAAFALVVGALLICAVSPIGPEYVIARMVNWLMFWPLMFVFFHRPRFAALAIAAMLAGVLEAIGVLLQSQGILGGVWGGALVSGSEYNPLTSQWLVRYTGFILDPNNLAIIMNLAAIAATSVFLSTRRLAARIACASVFCLAIVIIVLSGSRGGLLALPIGFLVYALLIGARGVAALLGSAAIAAYIAVSAQWDSLDNLISTLTGALDGQDESLVSRFAIWSSHQLEGFQYLVGSGFGGYDVSALSGSGFDIAAESAKSATLDNSWLKLMLEGGALAVGAFAFIFYVAFAAVLRGRTSGELNRYVVAAVGATLSVLLWRSLSTDALDINPFNCIVPLAVGASFAVGRSAVEPASANSYADVEHAPRPAFTGRHAFR